MFEGIDFSQLGSVLGEAQKQAQQLQTQQESKSFTAKSGGGLVRASVNGRGEVLDIVIDDSLFEDRESLVILLIGALNDALKMAESDKQNAALQMMGNFSSLMSKG